MPATVYCDTAHLLAGGPIWHVMANYLHIGAGRPLLRAEDQELLAEATNATFPLARREDATRTFGAALGIDVEILVESRAFGYMTSGEISEIYRRGVVDVQLHTHSHSLHDMSSASVQREIDMNAVALSTILGAEATSFRHFCYPSGRTSRESEIALETLGILGSTTTRPGLAFPGSNLQALPRFLDGDNVHTIEFEAELSGFMYLLRNAVGWLAKGR